jgi:FkbM family methyltransferase
LIEAAIAEKPGEITFFLNRNSVWGTIRPQWAERNKSLGSECITVKVNAIMFSDVLAAHGTPYYLKIDIEGADLLCLPRA